ncbi:MAG TPA: urea ABC transporter ATP-binding subunit UrtE [Polyangiaceae bacterium]|nr:urea ABC transporter ATP-binding subunit UrtE [Polyangiaceae bacterium]
MLEVERLNQYYSESHTLWDVDLRVEPGSCTCLMGRNGVGKTTLLKAIMGSVSVKSGSVRFESKELCHERPEVRARAGIGFVPQGREIFPQLTVEENLLVPLASRRQTSASIPPRIFELFPVLKQMLHRRGGDLSGGQQQQLAIGRALMLNPKLLILDEPTEGIQPNVVRQIGDVLIKLNEEEGLTILLVEQKLPFARRVGKHFAVLDRGRTVAQGAMSELSDDIVARHLVV